MKRRSGRILTTPAGSLHRFPRPLFSIESAISFRFWAHLAFAVNQARFSSNFDIAGAAYGLLALRGKYANPTM